MHRRSILPFRWWPFLLLLSGACGGGSERTGAEAGREMATASRGAVESWVLSPTPVLEIGVREGEEPYQLHRVQGSVLLEDGRVVLLNGGSRELRYYDPRGRFLKAVGRRGEGPGEFEVPSGLRRTADGGLQVWDGGLMRLSRFDAEGAFLDSRRLLAGAAELFPGDDWILGPNWIVSPVSPGARAPIRRAVEALPPPDSAGSLRVVRVTPQGRLWVPHGRPPADTAVTWDVYDLTGRPVARVETPAHFQPHEIGEDHITGLFLDEMDVNYVRVYGLKKPEESPPGPGLQLIAPAEGSVGAPPGPAPPEEVMAQIRSVIKTMASLEEIYYSSHYTYTTDLDALFGGALPDDLTIDVLFGDSQGWAARVSHPESSGSCVLAYGFYVPVGWQPGAVICL